MTGQVKVKNGTVRVPSRWEGATVYVVDEGDTMLIKLMEKPALKNIRSGLLKAGRQIKKKDLNEAIKDARQSKPARRS